MVDTEKVNAFVDSIFPPKIRIFLEHKIYLSQFFFLNYWSFIHFTSGAVFYFLFPKSLGTWIIINIVFETSEHFLGLTHHPLFAEKMIDTLWDLIITIGAFILMKKIFGKKWEKEGKGTGWRRLRAFLRKL